MIIHLNENRFNKFFLLTESKNSSKAKSQTLAILAQALGTELDSERVIKGEQALRKYLFDDLHLTNKEYDRVIKYEPLFMKCAIDNGYEINILFLKKYTDYIIFKTKDSPNPSEVMSRYMSANSPLDLYRIVNADMKADKEADAEEENNAQYTLNQNYDVLGPLSFDEAQVYGNESGDNGRGKICYTQGRDTWLGSNYSNGNENKCYLLLRKDWESVPCKHDGSEEDNGLGELSVYNGYDSYGLSMIFVFIEPNGELHECNTRWNHEAKYGPGRGVDHALNENDIARLMGAPFEKVFGVKKTDPYAEINERILNDEPVEDLCKLEYDDVVHEVKCVKFKNEKYNIIGYDGKVIWKKPVELWFDGIGNFEGDDDVTTVSRHGEFNLMNLEGKILSNIWFDNIFEKSLSYYEVTRNDKHNILRTDGTLVWKHPVEEWFNFIGDFKNGNVIDFKNGYAVVYLVLNSSRKINFLKPDGTLVWDYPVEEWFDGVFGFDNGFARVCINNKWNFLRGDGTLVWDYPPEQWFDKINSTLSKGLALVNIGAKWNYIKPDGTLLWDYPPEQWLDMASRFSDNGAVLVGKGGKLNYLRPNGTLIWDYPLEKWFDNASGFLSKGVALVRIGDKWNFIREDGTFVWDYPLEKWFDAADFFTTDLTDVFFKGKPYKLSLDGKLYDKDGNLVSESKNGKKSLLTESKNSSRAKSQTLAILAQAFKTEPDSEEVINAEQNFRKVIFDSLHLTNKEYDRVIKYEPLFMRCVIDVGYQLNISFLKKYTDYIIFKTKDSPNPSEVMSRYASANSFMDLYRLVKADMKTDKEAGIDFYSNAQYGLNQNYDVLGPLTFYDAQVYGNESGDNGSGKICYTQGIGTWLSSNYSDNNQNKCYLLLRKDWESVPCKHDGSEDNNGLGVLSKYNGYDDYGLSMIFVFIEPNGELHECNTRWNHAASYASGRGVDHALTENDIAMLIGAPFEKVFGVKKTDPYAEINERLANGKPVDDLVKIVGTTTNNYKIIFLNFGKTGIKYNFMKEDGTVVFEKPVELWFDNIGYFKNGIAFVSIDKKQNYLKPDGTLVWDYPPEKWFDYFDDFENGVARVCFNDKWNYLKKDGTFVWDYPLEKWFDEAFYFKNGFALVSIGKKRNYLKKDGTFVWDYPVEEWFDNIGKFDEDSVALVGRGGKWNYIRTDGTLVWDYPLEKWFDYVCAFHKGTASVCFNDKWNFIRLDGTLVWDYPIEKWFDNGAGFSDKGIARVFFNGKWNFIRTDGTLVWKHPLEEWFDESGYFMNDLADVQFKRKWYKLSLDGKLYDKDGNLVSESKENKKSLITESKNSSRAKKQTLIMLAQAIGKEPEDEFVANCEMNFRNRIFDSMHFTSKEYDRVITYEPLFMKCAIDANYPYGFDFDEFKKYTTFILLKTKDSGNPSEIISQYKANINGIRDLKRIVGSEIAERDKEARERIKGMKINLNQNYDVLGPLSFEQAHLYGNESGKLSNTHSRICYTQGEGTWNSPNYSNGDKNKCYLLLRKDWKTVPCEHDGSEANNGLDELSKYNGYDDYGLSMIFVFINGLGMLHECNTRWNHEASYGPGRAVDHALSEEDISKLMGAPFERVFGIDRVEINDYIMNKLSSGEDILEIFDSVRDYGYGIRRIKLADKYNFLKPDRTLLYNVPISDWFERVGFGRFDNHNNLVAVKLNGKWNFIGTDGRFLTDTWFRWVSPFHEGVACVSIGQKRNFIKTDGSYIWERPVEEWFDGSDSMFANGFVYVRIKEKTYCLDQNGQLLDVMETIEKRLKRGDDNSNIFDEFYYIDDGFYKVSIGEKYNILNDAKGELVWKKPIEEWFDEFYGEYFEFGMIAVGMGDMFEEYDEIEERSYETMHVNRWNFLKMDGTLLSDMWFSAIGSFSPEGVCVVVGDKGYNYINTDGRILSDEWYNKAYVFHEGFGVVEKDTPDGKRYNYLNDEGEFLSKVWFESARDFYNGSSVVSLNGKRCVLRDNGKLIIGNNEYSVYDELGF